MQLLYNGFSFILRHLQGSVIKFPNAALIFTCNLYICTPLVSSANCYVISTLSQQCGPKLFFSSVEWSINLLLMGLSGLSCAGAWWFLILVKMLLLILTDAAGNFLCPAASLSFNAFKTVIEIDTMGTFNASKVVYEKWFQVQVYLFFLFSFC